MTILVSGSVALDHIMVFPDRFVNHILPEKVHALNVSFNITSLKTHFGGVAANIGYHLRLVGEDMSEMLDLVKHQVVSILCRARLRGQEDVQAVEDIFRCSHAFYSRVVE